MKKFLAKVTGLSIVLTMIFNLFMPLMFGAVDADQVVFNPNGGTFGDGEQGSKTVAADSSTHHVTQNDIADFCVYGISGSVRKEGYVFKGCFEKGDPQET